MRIWFLRLKRCRGKPTLMIIWCATSRVSISPPRPSSATTAASGLRAPPSLRSSSSLSLSLSKFFSDFFGFDFQNSVRSGCFSCSIFIFLNFFSFFFYWSMWRIGVFESVCFLGKFYQENVLYLDPSHILRIWMSLKFRNWFGWN